MHSKSIQATLIALAVAALAGCYAPPESRFTEVSRSWSAAGIRKVEVRGHNGRINVVGTDSPQITMIARVRGRERDGNAESIIDATLEGDTLVVRERGRKRSIRIFPFGETTQIEFELTVPRRIELEAQTTNGRLEVEGVDGEIELTTVNGRINVSTPGNAELSATTVNGSIRAEFQNRFRGAQLSTINGAIAIEVPQDASLDLDIKQINGSFQTDLPVIVESSSRQSSRGSLHGGRYPLEIDTINGSVSLRQADLPPVTPVPPAMPELPVVSPTTASGI